jgi:hypothetical protein
MHAPPVDVRFRIAALAQLFDFYDPSPFHERALDPKADDYIQSCVRELPAGRDFRLHVLVPPDLLDHEADTATAIHAHYALAKAAAEREIRARLATGRGLLLLGLAVLLPCLLLRELIGAHPGTLHEAIAEGLLILGWVALWKPLEVLLFERFERRQQLQLLDALCRVPVRFEAVPAPAVAAD